MNPTQFAAHEDLGSYPRTWKEDIARLTAEGVDLVWHPDVKTMYPDGFATRIAPEGPALAGLEDRFRPHFFGGVATVVAKLFTQVRPDMALFGEKDFQQLKVVTRMARDLDLGVKVIGGAIIRERDGLAMSSRNVYLSPDERRTAPVLFRTLKAVAKRLRAGDDFRAALSDGAAAISNAGFALDYLEARHAETLAPVSAFDEGPVRLLVAGKIGNDAPDRQYQGVTYRSPSSRSSRRIGSGMAATLAAALPRSGGRALRVEITPALERPHRTRRYSDQLGLHHQTASTDAVLVAEWLDGKNFLARCDLALDDPVNRSAVEKFCVALRRHARHVNMARPQPLRLGLARALRDPTFEILDGCRADAELDEVKRHI